jgi:branched-subunit amino acid aminotransferase/4-amino-4-deoxychorismate lyase
MRPAEVSAYRPGSARWPPDLEQQQVEGLVLVTSPIRIATGSMLAGLKHGNRLEQVHGRTVACGAGRCR